MVGVVADYLKARRNRRGRHVLFIGSGARIPPEEITLGAYLQNLAAAEVADDFQRLPGGGAAGGATGRPLPGASRTQPSAAGGCGRHDRSRQPGARAAGQPHQGRLFPRDFHHGAARAAGAGAAQQLHGAGHGL